MFRFDPQVVKLNEGQTVEAILTLSGLDDPEKTTIIFGRTRSPKFILIVVSVTPSSKLMRDCQKKKNNNVL